MVSRNAGAVPMDRSDQRADLIDLMARAYSSGVFHEAGEKRK